MQQVLLYALGLALLIAVLTVVARRVHVLSPILLLIVGALIAFTPGKERQKNRLIKRLADLGYIVELVPQAS
jgi:membrane-bound ClpP family serine protease